MSTKSFSFCDPCGEDNLAETVDSVTITFSGQTYTLDVCEMHAKTITDLIGEVQPHRAPRQRSNGARRRSSTRDKNYASPQEIREWARSRGYEVSERGRISGAIVDAWNATLKH